jgi:hypothetical protein
MWKHHLWYGASEGSVKDYAFGKYDSILGLGVEEGRVS